MPLWCTTAGVYTTFLKSDTWKHLFCISTVSCLFYFHRTIFCSQAETGWNHHRCSDLGVGTASAQNLLLIFGHSYQWLPSESFMGSYHDKLNHNYTWIWEQLHLHCHYAYRGWHTGRFSDCLLLYTYVYILSKTISTFGNYNINLKLYKRNNQRK